MVRVKMKRTSLDTWILNKHGLITDDRVAVARYQLEKILETVTWARTHSRLYARLYEELGLPDSFESFTQYPFIDADDLIERGTELLCVSQSEIARIITLQTSGTTQPPKRVYFTREDIELTLDFFEHGMKTLCDRGDRALILFPAKTPDSVGALLSEALTRLGLTVFCEERAGAINLLHREPIDIVCGPASWLLDVAKQTTDKPVRAVLSSSEYLSVDERSELKNAWSCEVFDHFGMTETGLGGAVECDAHEGMHIRENDLYFEVINSEGQLLPDGEEGELVVTTLTRRGMPFIRYRTGDRAILSSDRCPCGSWIRRILHVKRDAS